MAKKTTTSNNKSIEVNRDILGRLLSISSKESKTIDFVKALHYPLCEVPLSLVNADGTTRKTNKTKLANIIISNTFTTDISKQQTKQIGKHNHTQHLYNRYIKATDCLCHLMS